MLRSERRSVIAVLVLCLSLAASLDANTKRLAITGATIAGSALEARVREQYVAVAGLGSGLATARAGRGRRGRDLCWFLEF